MTEKKAVVMLSGGLDSATVLALAKRDGFEPYAITFRYGQRHALELEAARRVAAHQGVIDHLEVERFSCRLRSLGLRFWKRATSLPE